MALAVGVTYLDRGQGQWAIEYDALNFQGEPFRTHGPIVQNTGSGKWKTAGFALPNAALCSPPTGWWVAVDSFGEMVESADVYVAEISVALGGVAIVGSRPVAAPGQAVIYKVYARDAEGQPQSIAGAKLQVGGRELLIGGAGEVAEFGPLAPVKAGNYPVTASVGGRSATAPLLVWPGQGSAQVESQLVDTAGDLERWEYWPVAARISSGALPDEGEGAGSWVRYAFTGTYWPGYVDLTRRTLLRGLPLDVNVEVRGEGGGTRLEAILEDATGQRFCYPLGALRWPEWTPVRGSLRGPTRYWGGAGDGVPHYPMAFLSLRIVQGPRGSAAGGQLEMRNVFVRTLAPGP